MMSSSGVRRSGGRHLRVLLLLAAGLVLLGGCGARAPPLAGGTGSAQAPLSLRNLEITTADGHRAVLLRLSHLPERVRYSSSSEPGEIVVQAWGPEGDGDLAERTLPQIDAHIKQVRVSRHSGDLRVVLEFNTPDPPPHKVHEMADWIMIRFTEPES